MKRTIATVLLLSTAMLGADPANTVKAVDAQYQQSLRKWKADLLADRRENWLSLAGLFWLKPGDNSFGMDGNNAITLPRGPEFAGFFILQDGVVSVKLAPEAHATINGKAVRTATLQPDISGNPTILALISLRMHVLKRSDRMGLRVKDLESPNLRSYKNPVFYPIDLSYRVTATWIPSETKRMVEVPTVLGDVAPTAVAGTAVFKLGDQELRLMDLGGDPTKDLFFVFSDLTSKTDTYPSGRFLHTGPVTGSTVVLDFNRAYNPPCALTPYATCPLAPKENRLSVAIPAGEKYDHPVGHR